MSVKSLQSRKISSKKQSSRKKDPDLTDNEPGTATVPSVRGKTLIEIEEHDALIGLDDKPEIEVENTDGEEEELGLDEIVLEEELDPFNDNWES